MRGNQRWRAGKVDKIDHIVRTAALALFLVCVALVPGIDESRNLLLFYIAAVVLPIQFGLQLLLARLKVEERSSWGDLSGIVFAAGAALVEPKLLGAALIIQFANIARSLSARRLTFAPWSAGLTLGLMTALLVIFDFPEAHIPAYAAAVVVVPRLVVGARRARKNDEHKTAQMTSVVSSLPILMWEADRTTGDMKSLVGQPGRVLGASQEQLLGQGYIDRIHSDNKDEFLQRFTTGDNVPLTYQIQRPDGAYRWISDRIEDVQVDGEDLVRGISYDVTAERQAHMSMARQSEIVQRMSAATIVLDSPGQLGKARILQITDPDCDLTPNPRRHVGDRFGDAFPELAQTEWLGEAMANVGRVSSIEIDPQSIMSQTRGQISVETEVFSLPDGSAAIIVENVTERERANAVIRHQASHDSLTNLPNRNELMRVMNLASEGSERFALALLDLNRFKNINDTLGHFTGDELLRVIANRLEGAVGPNDLVARLGGDEFAVVLNDLEASPLDARLAAIVAACREKASIGGSAVATGASIGVAVFPDHGEDPESLLRFSDIAMYEAKRASDSIRFYEPGHTRVPQHLGLMADLASAFSEQQFEPYFQPKLLLADGSVSGAEVLARWNHPERGLVLPGDFIELTLLAGQADELLTDMLVNSLLTLRQMPKECNLAVNLSAVNLRWSRLPAFIESSLLEAGISPSRLIVELTESELIDESGVVQRCLHTLADIGVGVSVDDFGTGYSSLAHLRSLPLTELKIDQQFVSGMMNNHHDHVIVKTLIDLGHNLGLDVSAEGVDDEPTRQALADMGCDKAQGFMLGRPMQAQNFLALFDPAGVTTAG